MTNYEQIGYGLRQTSILDELIGRTAKIAVERTASKPTVKNVLFKDPATIIFWTDNTKTVVKCQEGDTYDPEIGFVMCYLKKLLGNDNTFNKVITKWVPGVEVPHEKKMDNPPLTMDDFRKMDGQKVWVVDPDGIITNDWHIIDLEGNRLTAEDDSWWEINSFFEKKWFDEELQNPIAYRYKKED